MRLHELRDRHRRAVQALDRSGCQLKGHPCFMRRQQIRIRRLFVSWGKTIPGVEVGDAQHEHSIRSNGLQVFDTGFHQLLADSMALIHRRHAARCEQVAFCVRMVLEDERRKQHVACNLPVRFDTDRGSVANFLDGKASVDLASSLSRQLDELLKRTESGRELTFADHVDQFYACQDRCG